jgi:Uma2 family endonuclease
MGETPQHRDNLAHLIEMLRLWYRDQEQVYVSGNMFLYYVPGNRRKHVAPDVFVVRGIPRLPKRRRYLLWQEKKGPDLVIELTSASTEEEDVEKKFALYQDVLKVKEYFLFDPFAEYLEPPLQGYRLRQRRYGRIRPVRGRLPSRVLGLHLERNGDELRLYDPATGKWLPTPQEVEEALEEAEAVARQETAARQQAEAEVERLRREIEDLRRRLPPT